MNSGNVHKDAFSEQFVVGDAIFAITARTPNTNLIH
jgi:hypothetical protein